MYSGLAARCLCVLLVSMRTMLVGQTTCSVQLAFFPLCVNFQGGQVYNQIKYVPYQTSCTHMCGRVNSVLFQQWLNIHVCVFYVGVILSALAERKAVCGSSL